jgi:hypothetical protein
MDPKPNSQVFRKWKIDQIVGKINQELTRIKKDMNPVNPTALDKIKGNYIQAARKSLEKEYRFTKRTLDNYEEAIKAST